MKVSTDACLFGAWVDFPPETKRILDIGAGTGLLSLMTAQRFPQAHFTALEIYPEAAAQAAENVGNSPFREQIEVVCTDVQEYNPEDLFDAIICNPPFFQNSLKGPEETRNRARHGDDDSLTLEALLEAAQRLLKSGGSLMLLLPETAAEVWEKIAHKSAWQMVEKVWVQPLPQKAPNRMFYHYQKQPGGGETAKIWRLVLYQKYGQYTAQSAALLRPFYLYLL